MKRISVVALLALAACTSGKNGGSGEARELQRLAVAGAKATFHAAYRFEYGGKIEKAVATTIELQQRGRRRVARIQTTPAGGKAVASWIAERDGSRYACSTYAGGDVWCVPRVGNEVIGFAQIDDPLRLARERGFASVRKAGSSEVAGTPVTCFDAVQRINVEREPSPLPAFNPDRWKYRLCYSAAGVPLRVQRSADGSAPAAATYVFEATSVSRQVAPGDVELPGPVREPQQLISPTPTVRATPTPRRTPAP